MSLETLLEAAEFIEWRSNVSFTRGEEETKPALHPYAKPSITGSESEESNQTAKTGDFEDENSQEKRRSGGAGTREVHNKLEKNRRAHLKECFDFLKKNIPSLEDKRSSNLGILLGSLRYIQTLKRKEREYEADMQRLAKEKIRLQDRITGLKNELARMNIDVDLNAWVKAQDFDTETNSTSTATERGTPPPSDIDDDEDDLDDDVSMESKSPLKTPIAPLVSNPVGQPINTSSKMMLQDVRSIKDYLLNGNQQHFEETWHDLLAKSGGPVNLGTQVAIKQPHLANNVKQEIPVLLNPIRMPYKSTSVIVRAPSTGVAANIARSSATLVDSNTPSMSIPHPRTPVTQMLHQTLTQRQARLKQTASASAVSAAPITAAKLKSPPQSTQFISTAITGMPVSAKGLSSQSFSTAESARTSVTSNNIQPKFNMENTITVPVTFPFNFNMQGIPKGFAHPILVTSLTAPSVAMTTAGVPQTSLASSTSSGDTNNTSVNTSKAVGVSIPQDGIKPQTVPTSQLAAAYRPAYYPQNLLTTGHFALPLLTTQPMPQSAAMYSATNTGTVASSTLTPVSSNSQVTSVPIMSLAQVSQLSPLISPITVMSGMQMAASGLTQAQLNSMLAGSPLLKQFPLIPQSLIRPAPVPVVGQQVVKPVVMVTMPNNATTSATSLSATVSTATTTS